MALIDSPASQNLHVQLCAAWAQCHMWVEFFCWFLPSPRFFWVFWFSSLHKKQHVQIPIWTGLRTCMKLSDADVASTLNIAIYSFMPVTCWCLVAIWQVPRWTVSSGRPPAVTWTITTLASWTVRSPLILNRRMWSGATSPSWPILVTWNILLCYWRRCVSIHSSVVKRISLYCSVSTARIISILYNLSIHST